MLTVPEEKRKDWPELKKAFLAEFRSDPATCAQAFLARKRQDGESFVVYYAVMERLYREAFGVAEDGELSQESNVAITRQFLRGISQRISAKLQMDFPKATSEELAKQARCIEEVLARTLAPSEMVNAVEAPGVSNELAAIREELKEVKSMLKAQTEPACDAEDVNHVKSLQPRRKLQENRKCFRCGSPSHLLRDCDRKFPTRGNPNKFRGSSRKQSGPQQAPRLTCFNCGGIGHRQSECSSPPLN